MGITYYSNHPVLKSRDTYTEDDKKEISIDDGKVKTTYLKLSPSLSDSRLKEVINKSENEIKNWDNTNDSNFTQTYFSDLELNNIGDDIPPKESILAKISAI